MRRIRLAVLGSSAALAVAGVAAVAARASSDIVCLHAQKTGEKFSGRFLDKLCTQEATQAEISEGKLNKYELEKYAALGDSYSSGEGTPGTGYGGPGYYAGSNSPYEEAGKEAGEELLWYEKLRTETEYVNVNECHRSPKAWPARVAEVLYPGKGVTAEGEVSKQQPPFFIFRACSGAIIENIWPGYGQYPELTAPATWSKGETNPLLGPEQLSWLELPGGVTRNASSKPNPAIGLVTLSAGGNDSGFGKIGGNCGVSNVALVNESAAFNYTEAKCLKVINEWLSGKNEGTKKKERGPTGVEEEVLQGPVGASGGIPSTYAKLKLVLTEIHKVAPNAAIRVVLYPDVIDLAKARTEEIYYKVSSNVKISWIPVGERPIQLKCAGGTCAVSQKVRFGLAHKVAQEIDKFTSALNREVGLAVKDWKAEFESKGLKAPNVETVNTADALKGHMLGDEAPENASLEPVCPTPGARPEECKGASNQFANQTARFEELGLWVNGTVFRPIPTIPGAGEVQPRPSTEGFHPDCLGHLAMAKAVLKSVGAAVPDTLPPGWSCP